MSEHLSMNIILPTTSGLGSLPSTYHHLSFSKYSVLAPHDANLKGKISPHDLNCAVSSPNALIGSRTSSSDTSSPNLSGHSPRGAYFSIANSTSMLENDFQPYFTLLSFNIKPMDAPPPWTTITVNGYSHARNKSDSFTWHVDFPAGYHMPLLVKTQEYGGKDWDRLYGVEILADFGEQSLDWEFYLDNLEVQFFASNGTSNDTQGFTGPPIVKQTVLQEK